MAVHGKMLISLGAYWKGRKPLVLNRACVLAALLPVTSDPKKDLEIFEMLLSMDPISISKKKIEVKPDVIVKTVQIRGHIQILFLMSLHRRLKTAYLITPFRYNRLSGRGKDRKPHNSNTSVGERTSPKMKNIVLRVKCCPKSHIDLCRLI
jgi:hypothetical protein